MASIAAQIVRQPTNFTSTPDGKYAVLQFELVNGQVPPLALPSEQIPTVIDGLAKMQELCRDNQGLPKNAVQPLPVNWYTLGDTESRVVLGLTLSSGATLHFELLGEIPQKLYEALGVHFGLIEIDAPQNPAN